jgi:hypothetical protein
MASLMTTNFSGSGLDQVLSAHLDSLAISPQAKQGIIPALLGIAKITEVRAQVPRCVQLICNYFCCHFIVITFTLVLPSRGL